MGNKPIKEIAAIMFTDIVGYTELTSENEEVAFNLIKKKRELLLPLVKKHSGKLIKEIGDGTLTRYFDVKNAIQCANSFQSQTNNDLQVRAGIHTGSVIIENEDVYGDVVNIASRLESIAQPKSIFVSRETIENLKGEEGLEFISLGLQSLKGVGRLIEVYAVKDSNLNVPDPSDYLEHKIKPHSDDEVPSIAIIPFENKGAEEDVFYAFGICTDLISDCSGAGSIRVAGLKDIEKLDYANLQYHELSKKLDVRYIAQGTLWKMGEIFQLSIELYDTKQKKIIWTDRWDERWNNLPKIKSHLSNGLLKALGTIVVNQTEGKSISPEAYKLYLKGKHKFQKRQTSDDVEKAKDLLNKSIQIDKSFVPAIILLGDINLNSQQMQSAKEKYKTAIEKSKVLGLKKEEAQSLVGLARAEDEVDIRSLEKAFKIFKEINDKSGMVNVLNYQGNYYCSSRDIKKGRTLLMNANNILEEIEDNRGLAYNCNIIGSVMIANGSKDLGKVRDLWEKSLTLYEKLKDNSGIASQLQQLAWLHINDGNFADAMKNLKKALSISKRLGDKEKIAGVLKAISAVLEQKGDDNKSLKYQIEAKEIYSQIGNKFFEAITSRSIGITYEKIGKIDKAMEYFQVGYKINQTDRSNIINNNSWWFESNIGIILFKKRKYSEAIEFLNKALSNSLANDKQTAELRTEAISNLYLCLAQKKMNLDFDHEKIDSILKYAYKQNEMELLFLLYKLTEDSKHLEKSHLLLQERIVNVRNKKNIFINYPLHKKIAKEYKKHFND